MGSKSVLRVDQARFEAEVLSANQPVLVDVTTAWCGPCRALAPIVEAVAQKYAGRLKVVAVDADESPDIANRYAVRGFPTMILLDARGREVARQLGAVGMPKLEAMLSGHV